MRTLLLADDSITIQRVIALTFAEEAFKVITVSDGQQAIDRMAAQKPDIVLAGTTMPNVNGYELAKYVRSQPNLQQVPVLLLTGAFEAVDEERMEACGASGALEKPFEPSTVINRVKELLGMKGDAAPSPTAAAGRKATPAEAAADKKPRLQAVGPPLAKQSAQISKPKPSWDQLREDTGLADARSVEGGGEGFDGLDAAFDTLDEQLKRPPAAAAPTGEAQGRRSADPRSPGRSPSDSGPRTSNPVFEVDDEWFADSDKARAVERAEQHQLAAEMGINDVDLPDAPAAIDGAAPADGLDFDFGLEEDRKRATVAGSLASEVKEAFDAFGVASDRLEAAAAAAPEPPKRSPFAAPVSPFAAPLSAPESKAATAKPAPREPAPVAAAPPPKPAKAVEPVPAMTGPAPHGRVADQFAAMLAHEQGEAHAPVIVNTPPPEITDAMLEQIAERVAAKLGASVTDTLQKSVTDAIRDTVRNVVSETSERLVRDEIARIKSKS